MININDDMMSNYYGLTNRIDIASYSGILYLTYHVKKKSVRKQKKIFLNLVKIKLKSCKKQAIYYFKLFNAELANYLKASPEIEGAGIASLIKFEK